MCDNGTLDTYLVCFVHPEASWRGNGLKEVRLLSSLQSVFAQTGCFLHGLEWDSVCAGPCCSWSLQSYKGDRRWKAVLEGSCTHPGKGQRP